MKIKTQNTNPLPLERFESGVIVRNYGAVQVDSIKSEDYASVACGVTSGDVAFQRFMGIATGRGIATLRAHLSYRDESVNAPSYPASGTQPARLLAALLAGKEVNPLVGWLTLGIYRLSDTVYQLRNLGWPIITGRLDVKNRFGEQCRVANYHLPREAINFADDRDKERRNAAVTREEVA